MSGGTLPPASLTSSETTQAALLIASVVTITINCILLYIRYREAKKARIAVDLKAFTSAINSDDLQVLGLYLRDKLGSLKINSYADSRNIRNNTREYLKRLRELVNQPVSKQVSQGKESVTTAVVDGVHDNTSLSQGGEFLQDLGDKDESDWTIFAKSRRNLEIEFRNRGLISRNRALPPATAILPKNLRNAYGIFLSTANRAIHGEEVSEVERNRSLRALQYVLKNVEQIQVIVSPIGRRYDKKISD